MIQSDSYRWIWGLSDICTVENWFGEMAADTGRFTGDFQCFRGGMKNNEEIHYLKVRAFSCSISFLCRLLRFALVQHSSSSSPPSSSFSPPPPPPPRPPRPPPFSPPFSPRFGNFLQKPAGNRTLIQSLYCLLGCCGFPSAIITQYFDLTGSLMELDGLQRTYCRAQFHCIGFERLTNLALINGASINRISSICVRGLSSSI